MLKTRRSLKYGKHEKLKLDSFKLTRGSKIGSDFFSKPLFYKLRPSKSFKSINHNSKHNSNVANID